MKYFVLSSIMLAACAEPAEFGVALNWLITAEVGGTRTCLDANAATVTYEFTRLDDELLIAKNFDCVDSGRLETIPQGQYSITAKLRRGDGTVLATCMPSKDIPFDTETSSNNLDQCQFVVPALQRPAADDQLERFRDDALRSTR